MFNWDDFMNDFPYTNFSDINVSWFLNKFKQIFDEWEGLYNQMLSWKTATDEYNANWRAEQEQAFTTWENNFQSAIDEWKTQTETDINTWETDTIATLEAWKAVFINQYNALRVEVEQIAEDAETAKNSAQASATSAQQSADSASATAESLSSSLTQIATNTTDIADLKTQLDEVKVDLLDITGSMTEQGDWTYGAFQDDGYTALSSWKYAFTKKFPAGTYTITAVNSSYEFSIYYYVSDVSGTLVRNYANGTYNFTAEGTFIITARKHSKENMTSEELNALDETISIVRSSSNAELPVIKESIYELEKTSIKAEISNASITKVNGGFVNASANRIDTLNTYFYSSPFALNKGQTVIVTSADPSGSVVGRISKWNELGTLCEKIIATGTTNVTTVEYTASEETEYLVFSGFITNEFIVQIADTTAPEVFVSTVKRIINNEIPLSLSMFENIAVCGDSYTIGSINTRQGGVLTVLGYAPYGEILERMTGCNVTTYASGGADTASFQSRSDCLPAILSDTASELYIFSLGINDYDNSIPIGTIADINDEDYTQNPNSFFGNYGRIIAQVMSHAPNAKIILSTTFIPTYSSGDYYDYTKDAIAEIANHYGIGFIDSSESDFLCSDEYNTIVTNNGSHPTAPAYSGIAKAVKNLSEKCISQNTEYFNSYIPHPAT